MKIDILSLFPEMFDGVLQSSIIGKAAEKGAVSFRVTNFRDFTTNKHNKVDDYPFGGGAGMVLMPQPLFDAVDAVRSKQCAKPRIILTSPQGKPFKQRDAELLSKESGLIFICGHYEGFDERIPQHLATDEYSIGDFVMTGGELAAMAMIDSVVRLLPGVLGNDTSAVTDSFSTGLLEHPHYTRPADFRGMKVPDLLLSGNHEKIAEWRLKESLRRTYERRPDLLEGLCLTDQEEKWLRAWEKDSDNK
ncbi:tRNA (guanosine(37)-N1)-methyltransferase TrmD [Sporolactobacillus terrae]|uniref:tRNA (guanine-N(1)-)-methyltransferase n=1 Tax=Sporolactobacillus terrae TaxID=269673 RepID=A0A410D8C8_9BACL|nr:tRNA (guanosine(37)-N1)-methyltransferase TrmD [Sporolactobacillus terrae]QAA22324.1 tRNA (guanosine(37)-N1)-methyltransferase TrmD [Sporolactobacillus terrae]QAA25300.1 tRNA (guanosine(37)-N1)-methyltransferase TrmD [Sporolactobacillus terrae]UAK17112.1 tRNA (guanosine(37)-N1)-methyltransferase TrmD [Sporolactobacillus terrae]BBN98639.1 tRNA (guanine-N(1)-)-methyltransferase [Sporolactobacillus terrae]